MKILVQRVNKASVSIEGKTVASIGNGILIFVGIRFKDVPENADQLIDRILSVGWFKKNEGDHFSLTLAETGGEILVISQFTLYGTLKKGRTPSFTYAMKPREARELYDIFVEKLKSRYPKVQTGIFGSYMQVELENDGPATFILEN